MNGIVKRMNTPVLKAVQGQVLDVRLRSRLLPRKGKSLPGDRCMGLLDLW